MTTHCFPQVRGKVARFTRLDSCGQLGETVICEPVAVTSASEATQMLGWAEMTVTFKDADCPDLLGLLTRSVCDRPMHGPRCAVPWGSDPEHSDQRTPYTVDQLAVRREEPHLFAYQEAADYLEGWRLWRGRRTDAGGETCQIGRVDRPVYQRSGAGWDSPGKGAGVGG